MTLEFVIIVFILIATIALFIPMIITWIIDSIDGLFMSAIVALVMAVLLIMAMVDGENEIKYSTLHPDQYEYAKTNNKVFVSSDVEDLNDREYSTDDTTIYNHMGDTSKVDVVVRNSINYMGDIIARDIEIIVKN